MIREMLAAGATGLAASLALASAASAGATVTKSFGHAYGEYGNYAADFKVVNFGDRADLYATSYNNSGGYTECWADAVTGSKGKGKIARKLGMMRVTDAQDFKIRKSVNLGRGTYRVRVTCVTSSDMYPEDIVTMYSKAFRLSE
ncbi:hypothetical protein [Actinoplanes subglobosus]|uniref:Uncharacterized protein n=1 Tax=Actinoplanes subglobosus TaxID=1547892 RepID=A0ABV8INP9_9ACTN